LIFFSLSQNMHFTVSYKTLLCTDPPSTMNLNFLNLFGRTIHDKPSLKMETWIFSSTALPYRRVQRRTNHIDTVLFCSLVHTLFLWLSRQHSLLLPFGRNTYSLTRFLQLRKFVTVFYVSSVSEMINLSSIVM
jgi:hypothetical protein